MNDLEFEVANLANYATYLTKHYLNYERHFFHKLHETGIYQERADYIKQELPEVLRCEIAVDEVIRKGWKGQRQLAKECPASRNLYPIKQSLIDCENALRKSQLNKGEKTLKMLNEIYLKAKETNIMLVEAPATA